MATIAELANATIRMKAKCDKCVGWPLAAIKAIEGQGIRNESDVKRLRTEVLAELRLRKVIPVRRKGAAHARH